MSAEFAIILPALVLVIGIVLGALLLTSTRVSLVSAAHDIARLEARGDARLASNRAQELPAGARVSRTERGGILCIAIDASPGQGVLSRIVVSGKGCAAKSDDLP